MGGYNGLAWGELGGTHEGKILGYVKACRSRECPVLSTKGCIVTDSRLMQMPSYDRMIL